MRGASYEEYQEADDRKKQIVRGFSSASNAYSLIKHLRGKWMSHKQAMYFYEAILDELLERSIFTFKPAYIEEHAMKEMVKNAGLFCVSMTGEEKDVVYEEIDRLIKHHLED